MTDGRTSDPWINHVEKLFQERKLRSHQCIVYNKDSKESKKDEKCGCLRFVRQHSFDGTELPTKPQQHQWNVKDHTKLLPSLFYHSTPSAKFLRCSCETSEDIETLYDLMKTVCNKPELIVSVYGGRKYFTMSEDIEKEFMHSMAEAAITPGTWIITSGLNNGTAKLIGEGVARLRALNQTKTSVTLIGMAWWGNLAEKARTMVLEMKKESSTTTDHQTYRAQIPFQFDDKDIHSLERNHTHFLLLDDGKYCSQELLKNQTSSKRQEKINQETLYSKEIPRSDFVKHACETEKCYGVTLVVEGGINPSVAILNDIEHKRPVVFVQGTGKLADIISSLMELTAKNEFTPARMPDRQEIEHNLGRFPMRARTKEEHEQLIQRIGEIMNPANRIYLTVFRIKSELNLKQTILQAIFKAHFARLHEREINGEHSDKNTHHEHLLKLAISWDCFDQATDLLAGLQYIDKPELLAELFKQALDEDRPAFIDFFLRINYDPRSTLALLERHRSLVGSDKYPTTSDDISTSKSKQLIINYQSQIDLGKAGLDFIFQLYREASRSQPMNPRYGNASDYRLPTSMEQLDMHYSKWIGNFMFPLFNKRSSWHEIWFELCTIARSLRRHLCWCQPKCCRVKSEEQVNENTQSAGVIVKANPLFSIAKNMENMVTNGTLAQEGLQAMLRDLLLWAVFTDRMDMAKVLILHMKLRILAAIVCAAILKNRARSTPASDKRHLYKRQATDFEIYATQCIDACYNKSERKTCELLIREIPLFGNITCMQVAIASGCSRVINTDAFSQALNRIWFNKLAHTTFTFHDTVKMALSLLSFGLLAPWLVAYRLAEDTDEIYYQTEDRAVLQSLTKVHPMPVIVVSNKKTRFSPQLSYAGVNYCTRYRKSSICTWNCYVKKLKHFHQCPMVKMCYDFGGYIWFLLVFTYMMLFQFNATNGTPHSLHWTEIYTIITISVMLVEDVRRKLFYYITRMRERQSHLWILSTFTLFLHVIPYALFYVGILLWYGYGTTLEYFTAARIMLALDLEIWFLYSLKFISAVKTLGPKIFMVKNMLCDLCSFMYVAFICIAAYGVVSRVMTKLGDVQFTASSIFANIFYAPYWFLYADTSSERNSLDAIIANNTNNDLVAGATVTHVLLAFHMLFINLLILNLLIAVFATTINRVESNTKYIWRHQRYTFTQDYFEKPVLSVSPLIVISYLGLMIRLLKSRIDRYYDPYKTVPTGKYGLSGIFRMIGIDSRFTDRCTAFEHAATYDYARFVVEHKESKTSD